MAKKLPARTIWGPAAAGSEKRGRLLSRPSGCLQFGWRIRLTFDDVNDLVGVRAKNDVPAVHQDEFVSTPFRIDFHDA
jgi:hypothetical protein